jgi:hypothetical protein
VVALGAHEDWPEAFLGVREVDQVRLNTVRGDFTATDAALTVPVGVPHFRTVGDFAAGSRGADQRSAAAFVAGPRGGSAAPRGGKGGNSQINYALRAERQTS